MKYKINELYITPFNRLEQFLSSIPLPQDQKIMDLSMGQPNHPMPSLLFDVLRDNENLWNLYPPVNGTKNYRECVAKWLIKRYKLRDDLIAPESILPLSGSREGLFSIIQTIDAYMELDKPLVVGIPNPCFQTYQAAVAMCGGEVIPLDAFEENNFFPSLEIFTPEFCRKLSALYVCTPGNPQGTFADYSYISHMIHFAQKHNFIVIFDHCYSETYNQEPPLGALEVLNEMNLPLKNIIVMHSLSKRSGTAGLRSGFVTGDPEIIRLYSKIRSYSCAGMPIPIVNASLALLQDEEHVSVNRNFYRQNFEMAAEVFKDYPKFQMPKGGIFLWLKVNDAETLCQELWRQDGIKVLPGNFMTLDNHEGKNHGKNYIRIAMVHDLSSMKEALQKIRRRIYDIELC